MRCSLIQLNHFRSNWKRLGMNDEDLQALELAIMEDPAKPPVMAGTGGLRKVRFAHPRSSSGKSGGARICYAYFKDFDLVYLCAVYPKNEKGNLTAAEKNTYKQVLTELDKYLKENFKNGWTP
jgi:hypothetical protein